MSLDGSNGLFQESPLFPIQDQAVAEFRDMRSEMPEQLIGAFPKSYAGRIRRLFGVQRISTFFRSTMYVEEIKETEDEGAICIFIPNDDEIANLVINYIKKIPNYRVFVLVSPHIGYFVEKAFAKAEFEDRVVVDEFHYDLLLLEPYLFLAQAPRCFVRVFADNNIEDLTNCARALTKIQVVTGGIKNVYSFGVQSMRIKQIIDEQKAQVGSGSFSTTSVFDSLIIVDRTLDLLTPLLKQTSYNGLVDEILGSDCGFINIPKEITVQGSELFQGEILLSDSDPVFNKIRMKITEDVVDYIIGTKNAMDEIVNPKQQQEYMAANKFMEKFERGTRLRDEKPYVVFHAKLLEYITSKIKNEQSCYGESIDGEKLTTYTSDWLWINCQKQLPLIAEYHLLRDTNLAEVIREFCVLSYCLNGVPEVPMDSFVMRLLYRFGIDFLQDIVRFSEVGLLKKEDTKITKINNWIRRTTVNYEDMMKDFELYVPYETSRNKAEMEKLAKEEAAKNKKKNVKREEPKPDINNVYGGYVPLTARIIKYAIDDGTFKEIPKKKIVSPLRQNDITEFLGKILPVPKDKISVMTAFVDNTVGLVADAVRRKGDYNSFEFPEHSGFAEQDSARKILVFVVGGVTNSEALAIRELGKVMYGGKVELVIGTTEILTSTSFIYDISPTLKKADEMKK